MRTGRTPPGTGQPKLDEIPGRDQIPEGFSYSVAPHYLSLIKTDWTKDSKTLVLECVWYFLHEQKVPWGTGPGRPRKAEVWGRGGPGATCRNAVLQRNCAPARPATGASALWGRAAPGKLSPEASRLQPIRPRSASSDTLRSHRPSHKSFAFAGALSFYLFRPK